MVNHDRVTRAVVTVTAVYVVLLAIWIVVLFPRTPRGTLPYQLFGLVALFGAALGLSMMWAARPSPDDRRLQRDGIEGWAVIDDVREVGDAVELDLSITVPGVDSYSGRVIKQTSEGPWQVGDTVTIRVDPLNKDRVWWG